MFLETFFLTGWGKYERLLQIATAFFILQYLTLDLSDRKWSISVVSIYISKPGFHVRFLNLRTFCSFK